MVSGSAWAEFYPVMEPRPYAALDDAVCTRTCTGTNPNE